MHTYSLVPGTGSTDNASFTIAANALKTNAILDYEAKSSYSIRIRTTDSTTRTFEKVFTVTATNVNDAPTNIALSPSSIAENQSAPAVVGALSATDQDAGQTHTFTLQTSCAGGPFDNSSFTITGTSLNTSVAFNYEAKTSHTICVRAADNGSPGLSFDKVLTVTVTNVNEAPTNIGLTSSSIAENQVSGTTVGTLSSADPDAGQTPSFSLVTSCVGGPFPDNASFSITGTDLKTAASFNFEAKSSYTICVRVNDNGSPALTFDKVFTITVSNVNEAPMNTVPGGQTVNEDTDLTFTGGTAISIADPDGTSTNVKVSLDVAHGTLTLASTVGLTFVDGTANGQASVHFTGTVANINTALAGLKYRGTSNYNSTRGAESLAVVTNDQGNTGSGGALSDSDSVSISVSAVNDAPTAATKSFTVQANMKITGLSGLLGSATDPDTGDSGYTASFTVNDVVVDSCAATSTISNLSASGGTFDFDPQPGFTGTCTLKYRVNDSGNPGPAATSAYASITLTVNGPVIWFVNAAAAAGGNGRLSSPFNTLSAADAVDAANHGIFLYSSGTSYTGALTLNSGEKLIGQGTTGTTFDSVFGISPPTGTIARPTLGSGTATLTGTLTLASTVTLRGLALSTGASTGLTGSGSLTNVDVAQTSVTTTTGTAVNLNNAVGTYSFSGISTGNTGTNPAFSAVSSGTVTVAGTANTLATTTATALNVASTTIGAGGLTFRSISSNGAASGIVLNTTGATAGLTVTGNGSAGTGGTIQNSTDAGIVLTSTRAPSFSWMVVQNGGDDGIRGSGVVNFTLANSTVFNNGNAVNESGLDFVGGLTGTASISSSTVNTYAENGLIVTTASGTLSLTVTGSSFLNASAATGNDGIHLDANDTASMTASVTGSTFDNNRGDHFQFSTNASSSGNNSVTYSSNTLTGDRGSPFGNDLGAGITISTGGSSDTAFTLANNNIQGAVFPTIGIDLATTSTAGATLSGTVNNNTIGSAAVAASGGAQSSSIAVVGQGAGTVTAAITNNTIRQNDGFAAIDILSRDGSPTINATVTGNNIATPATGGGNGLLLRNGAITTDGGFTCAAITGNSLAGSAVTGLDDFRLRQRFNTTVRLPGYAGAAGDTAAVVAFVQGNNPGAETGSATVDFPATGGGFVGGAACPTP